MSVWIPVAGDIAIPKVKAGYVVYVTASEDDSVRFVQVCDGATSEPITNRLSTFLDRFEYLANRA